MTVCRHPSSLWMHTKCRIWTDKKFKTKTPEEVSPHVAIVKNFLVNLKFPNSKKRRRGYSWFLNLNFYRKYILRFSESLTPFLKLLKGTNKVKPQILMSRASSTVAGYATLIWVVPKQKLQSQWQLYAPIAFGQPHRVENVYLWKRVFSLFPRFSEFGQLMWGNTLPVIVCTDNRRKTRFVHTKTLPESAIASTHMWQQQRKQQLISYHEQKSTQQRNSKRTSRKQRYQSLEEETDEITHWEQKGTIHH